MSDCCSKSCQRKKELEQHINALRDKVNQIPEITTHLFGNPRFSDLKVKAGDTTFYVTKYLLGLKSKIFEETILEGARNGADNVLRLQEDPTVVEAMLEYICLQKKVKGSELATKVVQLASRYGIDDLKDQCELELLDNLTFEDAHSTLQIAYQEGLSVLYWKCSELIYHNFAGLEKYSVEDEIVEQPESASPGLTVTPDTIILTTVHGKVASDHKITNHSDADIVYKVYGSETSSRGFEILGPGETYRLGPHSLNQLTFPSDEAFIYYAPYVKDPAIDYQRLHLLENAKFLRLKVRR